MCLSVCLCAAFNVSRVVGHWPFARIQCATSNETSTALRTYAYSLDRTTLTPRSSRPCPLGHDQIHPSPSVAACWNCSTPLSKADAPLNITQAAGRELMRSWRAICSHLSSAISPGKLRFTLLCDVQDLESGRQVIESLVILPTLKSCTIRLGRQPNPTLNTLSRETSFRMTNTFVPRSPHNLSFAQLPRELRLQILDSTHLGYVYFTTCMNYLMSRKSWDIGSSFRIKCLMNHETLPAFSF